MTRSFLCSLHSFKVACRLALVAICSPVAIYAQSADLTPVSNLGMHSVTVSVPSKYTDSFAAGRVLDVPANYTASVFHTGLLVKPRFMAFSPTGVLHVADMGAGKIWAFPDADNDGVADTMIAVASGFTNNHDIKFYRGAMYVTETTKIWKCTDMDGDGIYETRTVFISGLGNNETTGHVTRTIVFDSVNHKAYVSIGSSCNVCREDDRAIIEQYNDDGTGRRVFVTGTRNAVGMAMHPFTNQLWANNNGSDQQGNETPPEWIDIVRDGGFYGHPFAYGSGVWFDFGAHPAYTALLPITPADSANVATMVMPAALVRAHAAPMALEFLNPGFGTTMQYGFLTALRGSWNTTAPNNFRGFKVIYGHLSSPTDTTVDYVADFCSGFLTDTVARVFWGRPVGIATDNTGNVFISSDEGGKFILMLKRTAPVGIKGATGFTAGEVYPNPLKNQFTLPLHIIQGGKTTVKLYSITGKEIATLMDENLSIGNHSKQLNIGNIAPGNYYIKATNGSTTITKMLTVIQ